MMNDPNCDPNAVMQQWMVLFRGLNDLVEQVYTLLVTVVAFLLFRACAERCVDLCLSCRNS